MVCLACNQIWWTWEVEDVFRKVKTGHKQAMKEFSVKQFRQIDELVVLVRGPLSKNDRSKFNTVLIIDVHARDIIDNFVRDSILDAREFQWESQLRSVSSSSRVFTHPGKSLKVIEFKIGVWKVMQNN